MDLQAYTDPVFIKKQLCLQRRLLREMEYAGGGYGRSFTVFYDFQHVLIVASLTRSDYGYASSCVGCPVVLATPYGMPSWVVPSTSLDILVPLHSM